MQTHNLQNLNSHPIHFLVCKKARLQPLMPSGVNLHQKIKLRCPFFFFYVVVLLRRVKRYVSGIHVQVHETVPYDTRFVSCRAIFAATIKILSFSLPALSKCKSIEYMAHVKQTFGNCAQLECVHACVSACVLVCFKIQFRVYTHLYSSSKNWESGSGATKTASPANPTSEEIFPVFAIAPPPSPFSTNPLLLLLLRL